MPDKIEGTMPDIHGPLSPPVQFRRGLGVALAVEWNLPFLLLFWFPCHVVHLVLVAHCFIWGLGCCLAGGYLWWCGLIFGPAAEGAAPLWRAASGIMVFWGVACLIAWYFEPRC
jgi:hypothetical protein